MKEIKEALIPYTILLAQIPESLPVKDTALQYLIWTTKQLCNCYIFFTLEDLLQRTNRRYYIQLFT